jgi:ligand-binding sensor domain-containing protein
MKIHKLLIETLLLLIICSCEKTNNSNQKVEKYRIFNIEDSPINSGGTDIIECIAIDNKNNVWMGCRPLIKYNGTNFEKYEKDIFGKDIFGERVFAVNDIDFDSKNNMWCGTNNGLYKYDGEKWVSYFYIEKPPSIEEPPFQTWVSNVHCDLKDNIWFEKDGNLVCYNGIYWKTFEYPNTFPGRQIQKITSDTDGNIFIGCFDALYKFDGNTFTKIYYSKNEGEDMNIRDLDFDKSGDLWISCRSNLLIYRDNELIKMDTTSIQNPIFDDYNWNVASLTINSKNDDVIIGTWNTGIAFYIKQGIKFYRGIEFGIDSNYFQINKLEFDKNNNLWIATRFGKIIVYNEQGLKF